MFHPLIATLAAASFAVAAAASVKGAGTVTFGSSIEHITVNATAGATPTSGSGRATFQNRAAGGNFNGQIEINCVNIVGNTATVSGIVTRANKKELIGREGVFQVVDNGKKTDFASIINFHEPGIGTNCTGGEFDLVPVKGDFTVEQ